MIEFPSNPNRSDVHLFLKDAESSPGLPFVLASLYPQQHLEPGQEISKPDWSKGRTVLANKAESICQVKIEVEINQFGV